MELSTTRTSNRQALLDSSDRTAQYHAGLWVVTGYGNRCRLAKKDACFGRNERGRMRRNEMDASHTFGSYEDAQKFADERNRAALARAFAAAKA